MPYTPVAQRTNRQTPEQKIQAIKRINAGVQGRVQDTVQGGGYTPVSQRNTQQATPVAQQAPVPTPEIRPQKRFDLNQGVNKVGGAIKNVLDLALTKRGRSAVSDTLVDVGGAVGEVMNTSLTREGRQNVKEGFIEGTPTAVAGLQQGAGFLYNKAGDLSNSLANKFVPGQPFQHNVFNAAGDELKIRAEDNRELGNLITDPAIDDVQVNPNASIYKKLATPGFISKNLIGRNLPNLAIAAIPGIATGGTSAIAGAVTSGLIGGTLEGGSAINQAKTFLENHPDPAFQELANNDEFLGSIGAVTGIINGTLEALPIFNFLNDGPQKTIVQSAIQNRLADVINRAGNDVVSQIFAEGSTEGLQEIVGNAVEMTYNENKELFEGVPEAIISGSLLGGGFGVAGVAAQGGVAGGRAMKKLAEETGTTGGFIDPSQLTGLARSEAIDQNITEKAQAATDLTTFRESLTPQEQGFLRTDTAVENAFNERGNAVVDDGPITIDTVNPTGSVFVEYDPQSRAEAILAPNLTTLAQTSNLSPDQIITIYRGAPAIQTEIVPGDFITNSYELAQSYAGTGTVISKEVRLGDVIDDLENYQTGEVANIEEAGEFLYRPQTGTITREQVNTINYGEPNDNTSKPISRVLGGQLVRSPAVSRNVQEQQRVYGRRSDAGRTGTSPISDNPQRRAENTAYSVDTLVKGTQILDVTNDNFVQQFNDLVNNDLLMAGPREGLNSVAYIWEQKGMPQQHVDDLRLMARVLPDEVLQNFSGVKLDNNLEAIGAMTARGADEWYVTFNPAKLKANPNMAVVAHEGIGHPAFVFASKEKKAAIIEELKSLKPSEINDIWLRSLPEGKRSETTLQKAIKGYYGLQIDSVLETIRLNTSESKYDGIVKVLEETGVLGTNNLEVVYAKMFDFNSQALDMIEGFGETGTLDLPIELLLQDGNAFMANETYARLYQGLRQYGLEALSSLPEDSVLHQTMEAALNKPSVLFTQLDMSDENINASYAYRDSENVDPSFDEYSQFAAKLERRSAGVLDEILDTRFTDLTDAEKELLLERAGESRTGLPDELQQIALELQLEDEAYSQSGWPYLRRYANRYGELPEVTGEPGGSKFAQSGDDIVNIVNSEQGSLMAGQTDDILTESGYMSFLEAVRDAAPSVYQAREDWKIRKAAFTEAKRAYYQKRNEQQIKEVSTRQRIRDELRGAKKERTRVNKRRVAIRAYQDALQLTNSEVAQIRNNRDIRSLTNEEFDSLLSEMESKGTKLREARIARSQLGYTIESLQLRKIENLQKALKLPTISNMSVEQLREFDQILQQYKLGDEFLSVRKIETVDNTDLAGIRTLREAQERLAAETGVSLEELQNLNINWTDKFRYDTNLAEQNPFYQLMVDAWNKSFITAEARFLEYEERINELVRAARQSRERGLLDKLVPTDNRIFDYIETPSAEKAEKALELTTEELEAANYIIDRYAEFRDYLVQHNVLEKYREDYITHIRRGFLETWKEDNLLTAIKEVFKQQELEQAYFNILDADTGNILPLEKFFQFSMKRTGNLAPTKNVASAFLGYARAFEKKAALDAMVPKIDIYAHALTPRKTTPRGLEFDRSIQTFMRQWLNTKKGRTVNVASSQGDKLNVMLRGVKAFTTLIDLGLNIPVGIASNFGEQTSNFVLLGTKDYAKGLRRLGTRQGRRIVANYKNFVGRTPWESMFDADNNFGDTLMQGLFSLFKDASVRANKVFLLGSLTDQEYASGILSPERLAQLRQEQGRYRVVEGSKSIMGSTAEGGLVTQYKTWAIPPLMTTYSNLKVMAKMIANGDKNKVLSSREFQENFRATIVVGTIALLVGGVAAASDDDDSFTGQILQKVYRDMLTTIGSLDPAVATSVPRVLLFIQDLGQGLSDLITLEQYKTKEGLKGWGTIKNTLRPTLLRNMQKMLEDAVDGETETSTSAGALPALPSLPTLPALPALPSL